MPRPASPQPTIDPVPSATPSAPWYQSVRLGWLVLAITVLAWAGFALSMRATSRSALTSADVALIRFSVPALVLLPLLHSKWPTLKRLHPLHVLVVVCGAGLPFFLLASLGASLTSAAHVSALVAGTTPLTFALLGWGIWRLPIPRTRWIGLALIALGISLLVMGLGTASPHLALGAVTLVLASAMWSGFTHVLRLARLDPICSVLLITYPSWLLLGGLMLCGVLPSQLAQAPAAEVLAFTAVQGVGVGLVSPLGYALAVRLLGASPCASAAALTPVLVTLLAIPVLGEQPDLLACLGIATVTAGVLMSTRTPH